MNKLGEIIAGRIRDSGAIPFRKFMEMALYCPVYGYYEKEEDKIGAAGDFYTSVSAGPLFGELLARQFAEWLKIITRSDSKPDTRVHLVEAAAHHGALAVDVLSSLQGLEPALLGRLEYVIVEPSSRRRRRQQSRLREFQNVTWAGDLTALLQKSPDGQGITGVLFSNELLDAMPVHRLGWNAAAQSWFEWGVDFADGRFVWSRLPAAPIAEALPVGLPPEMLAALPDAFTIETCPAAVNWWRQAARTLARGILWTCDYGLETLDFLEPGRLQGTLRAYRRHQCSTDVLSDPGEKDITAHVNFDALREAGEQAGLKTTGYCTQAQFLTAIALDVIKDPGSSQTWTRSQTRQFQTLTHPEHLGRAFRVLVQTRNREADAEREPGEGRRTQEPA